MLAAGAAMQPGDCSKGPGKTRIEPVPAPIDLLLPRQVEIHPFTQTAAFDTGGGGIHARVKALDAFGAETRAFGKFRFELYDFRPQNQDTKGLRLGQWTEDLSHPENNLTHWDRHTRSYEFKLAWDHEIPTGRELILVVLFTSRFTERLIDERKLIAGE